MAQTAHHALDDADLLLSILAHADIRDLGTAAQVARRCCEAAGADALWEALCAQRWATKAKRYHLTPARRAELGATGLGWREQYKRHEADGRRTRLKDEAELTSLTFDFRFRMSMQSVASVNFRFEADGHVSGHPNGLTYALMPKLKSSISNLTLICQPNDQTLWSSFSSVSTYFPIFHHFH